MNNNKAHNRRLYYLTYTAVFSLLAAIVFVSTYVLAGRDIIWEVDGIAQPFTFFVYEGMWLRGIIGGIFSGQGLVIPVWDMSFGYGSDIVPTLGAYFIDPFNLVSVFCPTAYAEYLFNFLVVLRLYLAGLAFSCYALSRGREYVATLAGALVYCFSCTALVGVFWPQGVEPLILFPFVLMGADRLFAQKKAGLLIASVTSFFLLDVSFSYICCLALVPYCAWRVFTTVREEGRAVTAGVFLLWVARVIGCLAIAFLISCVLLIPTLDALLSTDRLSFDRAVPLFYDFSYYRELLSGFITSKNVGSDCYIGYGACAFLACCALFIDRGHLRENRSLIVAFVGASCLLLIPFAGHVLNGFNYVTNRWVWIYALIVSYAVCCMIPRISAFSHKQNLVLLGCTLAYGALVGLLFRMIVPFFCALYLVLLLSACLLALRKPSARMRQGVLVCCVVVSLVVCGYARLVYTNNGWSAGSMVAGTAASRLLDDTSTEAAASVDDGSLWRYDSDMLSPPDGKWTLQDRYRNTSLVQDLNGIDYYWSFYNENIDRFHTELAVNGTYINFSYSSLDGRAALLALSGVKYYVSSGASGNALPYNYDDVARARGEAVVSAADDGYADETGFAAPERSFVAYEGEHTLPLAFTYSTAIPRSSYLPYSPLQRQQALLQGVVLDDDEISESVSQTQIRLTDEEIAWHVESADGLALDCTGGAGSIAVATAEASVTLAFDSPAGAETYLCFDDLNYAGATNSYNIAVQSDRVHDRKLSNFTVDSHMYGGKEDWCVNLGYSEQPQYYVTLTFDQPGTYTFSDLSIVAQPMADFDEQVALLRSDVLDNIEEGDNRISGNIDLEESKYLYLSVPYSTGWKAYVDGVETPVLKANTAFMAVYLTPGYHEIEFVYTTPGLALGAILSGIGILLLCGLLMWQRRKNGSDKRPSSI